jgi:hypothetical protein
LKLEKKYRALTHLEQKKDKTQYIKVKFESDHVKCARISQKNDWIENSFF